MSNNNGPEKKIRAGAISATIWKNKVQGKDDTYFSVTIERNYKDKDGNWKSTSSMRINDLPKAQLVLTKAYEYIIMGSKDDSTSNQSNNNSSNNRNNNSYDDRYDEEEIVI